MPPSWPGTAAVLLTCLAFLPYIRSTLRGRTRPHVFSWVIWGTNTALAYLKRADVSITPTDWLFLGLALAALPLWHWTDDPLWAVWLITVIELLGFGPTLRNALIVAALDRHTTATVLFPAAMTAACLVLIVIMAWRRPAFVASRPPR